MESSRRRSAQSDWHEPGRNAADFTGSRSGEEIWDVVDEAVELVPRKTTIDNRI